MIICDKCNGELEPVGFKGTFYTVTVRTTRNPELCLDCAEEFQDVYQEFIIGELKEEKEKDDKRFEDDFTKHIG